MTTPDKHGWYRIDYSRRDDGEAPFGIDPALIYYGGSVFEAFWNGNDWHVMGGHIAPGNVSHWQPLPLPPENLS